MTGRLLLAAILALAAGTAAAQSQMEELVVSGTRGVRELSDVPASISLVGRDVIQDGQQQLTLDESLARVPGVFLQNSHNFSQAQRISIRGFGARSPFGIRGIKLIIDGVPATMPDGQGNVDEIDLGSAQSIEVLRGPASSLYGSAAGGVISIITEEGPEDPYLEGRVSVGEYGYRQYQLKSGGQIDRLNYLVSGSKLDLDGYRDNAFVDRLSVNSKLGYEFSPGSDLTATLNILDIPSMGDPGALNQGEVAADRSAASPNNLRFDGGESRSQQRLGLVYERRINPRHAFSLRNYYTSLAFENRLPFSGTVAESNGGQVAFDRLFAGFGGQYTYSEDIIDYSFRIILGFDLDYQRDDRQRYVNREGGVRGDLSFDQIERVVSQGLYLQSEFPLLDRLQLTVGARYDKIEFDITDEFLADNAGNDSGEKAFDRLSPRIGLLWDPLRWMNLYFNFSTAFETPTTTEFANPDGGGFNPDLTTQTAGSIEFGMKGAVAGPLPLDYEIALFKVEVDGELVPFEEDGFTGRTFYRNAGLSSREGIEAGFSAEIMPVLSASLAYSYINARYDRYRTPTVRLDGNRIPGVPNQHLHAELRFDDPGGWFSVLDLLYVEEFYADDDNLVQTDPYAVSNFRVGYRKALDNWTFTPFVSVNNLFNEDYFSNVRVNAGFGRYYEPAPPRNIYGGLSARMIF